MTQKLKTSVCSVELSWRDKAAFTSRSMVIARKEVTDYKCARLTPFLNNNAPKFCYKSLLPVATSVQSLVFVLIYDMM